MDIQELFQNAVAESKSLSTRPGNESLLKLYSLYKQGTEGDAPKEGPANFFDIVGKAKHEAWSKLKGISKEDAMQQYIELVKQLKS